MQSSQECAIKGVTQGGSEISILRGPGSSLHVLMGTSGVVVVKDQTRTPRSYPHRPGTFEDRKKTGDDWLVY